MGKGDDHPPQDSQHVRAIAWKIPVLYIKGEMDFFFFQAANSDCLYGFGFRFNKTRDHFPTLKDYNDYLEEVEDMSGLFVLFVNLSFVNHTYLGKLSRA